jgi:hypothetical protein
MRRVVVALGALVLAACTVDTGGVPIDDGDGGGGGPDAAVDADPNATYYMVNVVKAGNGQGRVVSAPGGIDCGNTCTASFVENSTVILQVQPAPGSQFVAWAGACAGQSNPCSLTMTGPMTTSAQLEPAGEALWGRLVGGNMDDEAFDVAIAPDGDIVVAGAVKDEVDFGLGPTSAKGNRDWAVMRYAPDGSIRWAVRAGGSGDDAATGVAVDTNGDVYVTGHFQGSTDLIPGGVSASGTYDAIVIKYAKANGAVIWSQPVTGSGAELGKGIAVAGSLVFATGAFTTSSLTIGTATLSNQGGADIYLTAFATADGALTWARPFGGADEDLPADIDASGTGPLAVVGTYKMTVNFGGGVRPNGGKKDLFVVAVDRATGMYLWDRTFGGNSDDFAQRVAVGDMGEVIVVGEYEGTIALGGAVLPNSQGLEGFVAKYDMSGAHQWSRGFAGSGNDLTRGVDVGPGGTVVVTGTIGQAVDFGAGVVSSTGMADVFVVRYGSSGIFIWARTFTGSQVDFGIGIAVDSAGFLAVTGNTRSALDVGLGPLTNEGGVDLIVSKLRL